MTIDLISNQPLANHTNPFMEAFQQCEEAYFAVAFLRTSGLKLLLPGLEKAIESGVQFTFITGFDFFQTEPAALRILFKYTQQTSNVLLYVAEPTNTFHPKLYFFKNGRSVVVLSGSANLTSGGLSSNEEASVLVRCEKSAAISQQTAFYFEDLLRKDWVKPLDWLTLLQYEKEFKIQSKLRRKLEEKPDFNIRYDWLKGELSRRFKPGEFDEELKHRRKNYQEAKSVLDEIAQAAPLSKASFEALYERLVGKSGEGRLWHSDGLYRGKSEVIKQHIKFQRLVKYIRENRTRPPEIIFKGAKAINAGIHQSGPNIMTEVLITYNPDAFPIVNNNQVNALRKAGCALNDPSRFTPSDYADYCALCHELRKVLKLDSMLAVDTLLNRVYWESKRK